jgi:putative zinc finger protein
MRCQHEHDDGAYVLGALSPAERAAYERHLATCSFCREAVADIAVLPGLLGRLDAAEFAKLLDPTLSAPAAQRNRMPDLVTAAQTTRRKERRRLRVRVMTTALAAAVVALIVGIGTVFWMEGRNTPGPAVPGPTVAMTPIDGDIPVSADVSLTGTGGGTKVNLVCVYRRNPEYRKSYTVRLVAYGPDNEADQMGSWVAAPGKEFRMTGVTHIPLGSLSRLELVRNDGQALLAYDVP